MGRKKEATHEKSLISIRNQFFSPGLRLAKQYLDA